MNAKLMKKRRRPLLKPTTYRVDPATKSDKSFSSTLYSVYREMRLPEPLLIPLRTLLGLDERNEHGNQ